MLGIDARHSRGSVLLTYLLVGAHGERVALVRAEQALVVVVGVGGVIGSVFTPRRNSELPSARGSGPAVMASENLLGGEP